MNGKEDTRNLVLLLLATCNACPDTKLMASKRRQGRALLGMIIRTTLLTSIAVSNMSAALDYGLENMD
jgi:hypothetical protein